ncbi:hypothetical protein GW17_00040647 [Ensete ventricosum]|nr:hypothetical protein GW17_00040647 [Ensete ventricosum]
MHTTRYRYHTGTEMNLVYRYGPVKEINGRCRLGLSPSAGDVSSSRGHDSRKRAARTATSRGRPVGSEGNPRAARRRGRLPSTSFFFSLFLLQSTVDDRNRSSTVEIDRRRSILAVPPDSGRSAYRSAAGPVCTGRTGPYRLKKEEEGNKEYLASTVLARLPSPPAGRLPAVAARESLARRRRPRVACARSPPARGDRSRRHPSYESQLKEKSKKEERSGGGEVLEGDEEEELPLLLLYCATMLQPPLLQLLVCEGNRVSHGRSI